MKKILALLMSTVIIATTMFAETSLGARAESDPVSIQVAKEQAVSWLQERQNENGSYGNDRTVKDTCSVLTLFRDLQNEQNSTWLTKQKEKIANRDSAARYYCATDEDVWSIIGLANEDGGYGLTEWYESDIIDTMLVLEAYLRRNMKEGDCVAQIQSAIYYLGIEQNEDGGFSYLPDDSSDDLLTVQIGVLLQSCKQYGSEELSGEVLTSLLQGVEQYLDQHSHVINKQVDFQEAVYEGIYECLSGKCKDTSLYEQQLIELQNGDGSYFSELDNTIAAIRLMLVMEECNKPRVKVSGMETELSTYTACVGYDTEVEICSRILYQSNYAPEGTLDVEIWKNGELTDQTESSFFFDKDQDNLLHRTRLLLHPVGLGDYQLKMRLYVNDEVAAEETESVYVSELSIEKLALQAEYIGDQQISLEWNDISNDYVRFGYRIMRSCDGEEWETRSSWGGSEKVKVLNVYPRISYLNEWLTSVLAEEKVPAGKGLFEVSAVSFSAFNRNPDSYLLDQNGDYKYDVIYFGASDDNSGWDLSQASYLATKAFSDTGRGVLFGHDTLGIHHTYFAKFADIMGVKLILNTKYVMSTQAKVVNEGVLTSYPWKLQGILSIPRTHATQQYTGGTTKATVWMELTNGGAYDAESGARASAYLFSRNQYAMIQTGHSEGQASDDERKVLANTLFYLKQLTSDTSVTDHSAYDLAAPGVCEVTDMTWIEEGLRISVQAEDEGTDYSYYILAQPQTANDKDLVCESQVQTIKALSGIQGYAVCITDKDAPCREQDFGEVVICEDGVIELPVDEVGDGMQYLHIKAVDKAGNYGEESVYEIPEKDLLGNIAKGLSLLAEEGITVYSSDANFEGDVYAGSDILMLGSRINLQGVCSAKGHIGIYAAQVSDKGRTENCEKLGLPEYNEKALRQLPDVICTDENYTCHDGELNIGSICSFNGDIQLSGSRLRGEGILYAPNGTVTLNVADIEYRGSIIAKRIILQGSHMHIEQQLEAEE